MRPADSLHADFGDWANLYRGDVPTFLNLWYLLTLRQLATLLKAARMPREAATIAPQAAAHEKAVLKHLVDRRSGLLIGGLGAPDAPGVHEQTIAMLMGLVSELHQGILEQRLLPWIRGENSRARCPRHSGRPMSSTPLAPLATSPR